MEHDIKLNQDEFESLIDWGEEFERRNFDAKLLKKLKDRHEEIRELRRGDYHIRGVHY